MHSSRVLRSLILLLVGGVLVQGVVGCASSAAPQHYRTAEHQGAPWNIRGELHSPSNELKIFINGETVIQGQLTFFSKRGDFTGSYRGHEISASCHRQGVFGDVVCGVYIDNQRAVNLTF